MYIMYHLSDSKDKYYYVLECNIENVNCSIDFDSAKFIEKFLHLTLTLEKGIALHLIIYSIGFDYKGSTMYFKIHWGLEKGLRTSNVITGPEDYKIIDTLLINVVNLVLNDMTQLY